MDEIEEKSNIVDLNIESTNDEPNNVEPDSNIPRTLPDLEINDSAPDSKENNENVNSPNFILDSEETKEKPLLTIKDNENFDKNTNENNNENNNDESNNNEQNNEKDESNGGELTDIVPGSVGNKIRHFEVIQEEKKKEKIPPVKMTRKAFRSRVNSTQVYKRESLALLASNADNKLRIQTVISQLFNNNEENTSNSNSNTPVTTRSSRINSFKNQLSNKEMTMETFLKKIRQNNGEIEEEDEENIKENETVITNNIKDEENIKENETVITNNIKDEENIKENETVITNNIKDEDDVKYNNNKSENIIENNENKNNIEVENTNNKNFNKCNKRNSRADLPSIISKNLEFQQCTSQNSPLRTTSNIPENEGLNENSGNNDNIEINNKVIENENVNIVNKSDINDESGFHEIKLDSKSSLKQPFHFQSQQNVNEYDKELDVKQSLSLSSNELIKSKTDCSLNKVDVIQPLDKQHVAVSDTQLNTMNSVKKFKTQFIKISSKKNSRANIKSIHVKGNGEHSNSNSQENMNPSLDSVSDDSVSSINNLNNTRKASSDQNNRHPIEVLPLKINTKMTSDTNLYRCKKNDMIMSSKSSKSFVAIPTVISKKQLNKNSKPVEMRHITKKSSISTISSHSDDESISSPISAPVNDKLSSPANEKRLSRLNEYDTDILYEYFEEESLDDIINSESLSIRSLSVDSTRTQNNKPNSLSIKTNVKHNVPGLGSNDIMTSGVTPLDQVYNSISEELEQRLCKTVRHSILQRVDSNNFMIPINILYEKYYKTQVIYVERKMTIEEVLQQALNSINIYEDYGNYDLLQVFGFEDIIEEEEENNIAEENETKKNESDEEKSNSSLECNGKYQNVLDPTENVESILENTFSGSNRKTNNILTFRIRKKSSTMKLQIYLEEEKKYYKVMVTKKTTCSDVIKALLFLINEPYSENNWYIQRKHLDNYEEGKDILELTDTLYNKEEKIKYILKRKNSKQMSKLANLLGVTDESDLHNIVDNKESKKKKDKDKASKSTNELIKFEPLKDSCDTLNEYSEENSELFSRILSLDKEEIYRIYLRNKKLNNNKKKLEKKKCGSLDQLNLNSGSSSSIKEGERFSSQVFNIFKSKKEKRLSKLRDSMGTGSMPALSLLKDDNSKDSKDDLTKYDENGTKEFSSSNNDLLEPGKRAKKLGNFFGVNPYQRENTELNNIIRKNYNSKKAMDNAQQFVVIRVYFANFSFTTVNMSINDTCKTLKKILCEKLGVKESDEGLYQIYEFTQKNGCKSKRSS
ncbi:hypothetical protein BCR36DRAFT_51347 [Piromyces finnis]|uniref:Ras-associating domain-containing protein n=1 Tax=Piromyces finnis TaxID=1754191 RepID=A0A1Y1VP24_9FUNG|nr:hypothetical protein BCR36DRAFT_51347 [Piromyces finnis]|eukprot:ORX60120.1 hypothetical protein BCR36DRAFT_51347 [Piromyces finnis]